MASRSMTGKRVKASWWVRLTQRERQSLMLLGTIFLLVFATAIIFLRMQKLKVHDDSIAAYREAISKVFTEGSEGLISTTPLSFTSHIAHAESLAQVKATDQEEKPPVDEAPGLRKRVITFEMRDVTLEQMLKFISTVEGKRGHIVLTERLEIRNLSGTGPEPEDRLKVDFQMATWERYGAPASEEDS